MPENPTPAPQAGPVQPGAPQVHHHYYGAQFAAPSTQPAPQPGRGGVGAIGIILFALTIAAGLIFGGWLYWHGGSNSSSAVVQPPSVAEQPLAVERPPQQVDVECPDGRTIKAVNPLGTGVVVVVDNCSDPPVATCCNTAPKPCCTPMPIPRPRPEYHPPPAPPPPPQVCYLWVQTWEKIGTSIPMAKDVRVWADGVMLAGPVIVTGDGRVQVPCSIVSAHGGKICFGIGPNSESQLVDSAWLARARRAVESGSSVINPNRPIRWAQYGP